MIFPEVSLEFWACRWGGDPTVDAGGQQRNQTANTTDITTAAALPLTTLSAITLTVGEALVVASAASVAAITNAMAMSRKVTSIIPVH